MALHGGLPGQAGGKASPWQRLRRRLCLLLLVANAATPVVADPQPGASAAAPMLVLIIDDLGNNIDAGRRAIQLPGAITYAVLPHTPAARKLAWYAKTRPDGKEVIIHMPMQAEQIEQDTDVTLTAQQDKSRFVAKLQAAIDAVPFATGLNNHMGSSLTRQVNPMNWLMESLAKHGLFFIDSRTTDASRAAAIAEHHALPHLSRDVFLDHHIDRDSIQLAFQRSLDIAISNGIAVVIAHPHDVTLAYLEQVLPHIDAQGVELVTASHALQRLQELNSQSRQLAKNPSTPPAWTSPVDTQRDSL